MTNIQRNGLTFASALIALALAIACSSCEAEKNENTTINVGGNAYFEDGNGNIIDGDGNIIDAAPTNAAMVSVERKQASAAGK